MSIFSTSG